MTALLVAVTFGALGLAGALLFYVLRLTREERDRSAARAAALTELIGEGASGASDALPDATGPAPMFGSATTDARPASRGLLLVPVGGALVLALTLAGIYAWNRPPLSAVTTTTASPLELVSLRHERQGSRLVVSGLVRNPHAGQPVKGLSAVVFTFDRQGTFLTSGRALLDFPLLGSGDESPFSIALPQSARVGRYRVSFRTDSGVVAHLDRREPAALSANTQVTR